MNSKIIAVDFDGTLCENNWPEIGKPNEKLIEYLRNVSANGAGAKLILWTCRTGELLQNAIDWCSERLLYFDAVNENLPETIEWMGGDSRKIYADEYIDDRNYLNDSNAVKQFLNKVYGCESAEFIGRLVDVVEDWLDMKGITVDDIPNGEREDTDDAAIIYGTDYDWFADKFSAAIGINYDSVDVESHEKSKMQSWAEREIEIACELENPDRKPGEWDYGCTCYESALKAFNSLLEDGHSGFSIDMTKYILNRLIEGKPLTLIEDTDDIWDKCICTKKVDTYQCKRMSSLFKYIYPDGSIKYRDYNRICCVNVDNSDVSYHNGLVSNLINEMYPITMPYMPESKPFMVHCEKFLTDAKNGDYDAIGILYVIKPNGDRVDINRFFKEGEDDFVEITPYEYEMRRKMHEKRLEEFAAANQ